jgi:trigger factor
MKRAVRQRCGFGCVICGLPVCHIDHVIDYAVVRKHEESNLTLLCPLHHQEKSSGRLTVEAVSEANANPVNKRTGTTAPHTLYFGSGSPKIEMGRNWFSSEATLVALAVDGLPLLAFGREDGGLLLSLLLLDEFNFPILQILDNELIMSATQWDAQLVGKTLTLRKRPRDIALELVLDPPDRVVVTRGSFLCNGVRMEVGKHGFVVNGDVAALGNAYDAPVGYAIGRSEAFPNVGVRIRYVSRTA